MTRRKALRLLGIMVATLGGRAVHAEDLVATENEPSATGDLAIDTGWWNKPVDFTFSTNGIRNIIFTREGKPDIVIPFADIIKELE